MQKIKIWYFASPLLFAVFNVLFLYSANIDLVGVCDIIRPLLVILGCSVIILLISTGIFKEKGPLLSVVILLFIFLFGHMELFLKIWCDAQTLNILRHLWFVLFFVVFLLTLVKIRKIDNLMKIITFILTVMIVATLVQIIIFNIKNPEIQDRPESIETVGLQVDTGRLQDIYYIIFDGYARGDTLKELYNYDNSDFLNYLEQKGFRVPEKSVSNYSQTMLCLSSILNLNFIDHLTDSIGRKNKNRAPLMEMVKKNKVQQILKSHGYTTVCLYSEYTFVNMEDSDFFITTMETQTMTQFETILYNTTIFSYLNVISRVRKDKYDVHKSMILSSFERLGEIPEIKGPTFTFAHITCPHPPFIFEENGEISKTERQHPFSFADCNHYRSRRNVDSAEYQKRYRKQLIYSNELIKKTIDKILSTSDIPPIIILQADHGPGSEFDFRGYARNKNVKERFAIFSAYYLPDGGDKILYDTISSVNTFRSLFNHYFDANYSLLEDRSYYSTWDNPYDFIEITKELE